VPMKVKELMLVLRIEVVRRYKPNVLPQEYRLLKIKVLKDTRLG